MKHEKSGIILFDGVCNLCNGAVQFIIKKDKKGKFLLGALQSDSGQELLKQHNLSTSDFDSFVYIKNGNVFQKSTGALHVVKDLGGAWKLLYFFIIIPKPIRDYFYNLIAKNRYSFFGRKQECMMPTPEIKSRFLP